jgi:hypothetical protein
MRVKSHNTWPRTGTVTQEYVIFQPFFEQTAYRRIWSLDMPIYHCNRRKYPLKSNKE